jgi:hypothetical protein
MWTLPSRSMQPPMIKQQDDASHGSSCRDRIHRYRVPEHTCVGVGGVRAATAQLFWEIEAERISRSSGKNGS